MINEMRDVSIIFGQVVGVDVSTDAGAQAAQTVMLQAQDACHLLDGTVNKSRRALALTLTIQESRYINRVYFGC